jgi:Xaa-Pro aminopeptidase
MAFERLKKFFSENPEFDTAIMASWDAAASPDANFSYYAGIEMDRGTLIARRGETPFLIANPLNYHFAQDRFAGEVVVFSRGGYKKTLEAALAGAKKIAMPKSSITASLAENVRRASKAEILDASAFFLRQRASKAPPEIVCARKAARIARRAFECFEAGRGEAELAANYSLQAALLGLGAEPSFKPIVAFDRNSRFPHAQSGALKLRQGSWVMVDWGARWKGYCSDHTRCFSARGKARANAARKEGIYATLKHVFSCMLDFLSPGMPAADAAAHYHSLLAKQGLPVPPHSLGHGIGLEVHEYPSFGLGSKDVLQKNSLLAIEPSYYCREYGVRFEETVLLERKARVL